MQKSVLPTLVLVLVAMASSVVEARPSSGDYVRIKEEMDDTSAGKGFGGLSGMMIGAVGGPIGVVVGGLTGMMVGGGTQDAAGGTQKAYIVTDASGEEYWYRSPRRSFEVGERAQIVRGRLQGI